MDVESRYEKALEVIRQRNVKPCNAFLAGVMAGLHEFGILTQGLADKLGEWAAPIYYASLVSQGLAKGELRNDLEAFFKGLDYEDGTYKIAIDENKILVEIETSKCKICPKGVGQAEIPGTACPIPRALETIAKMITKEAWRVHIEKEGAKIHEVEKSGGKCRIILEKVK